MSKGNDPKLERTWRRRVERQRVSGLTARSYCAKHRLSEPSFYAWRRIIAQRDQANGQAGRVAPARRPRRKRKSQPAFLPVVVAAPVVAEAPIDIRLRTGQRLRVRAGCDRKLLAEVVALLEGRSC
jgi:hypothetical protein